MIRKILVVVIILLVVTLGAAAYGYSQGAIVPGLGAKDLEQVIDRPATGDSIELANFAKNRCRLAGTGKQACYEEIFLELTERGQVRLAMDALSVLSRIDPASNRYGHDLTHVVGINAWTPGKDVGTVYESCTGLYQSGCYHGVVQAYLDAQGTDSTTVYGLCNDMPVTVANLWLRFQCVHGIGHGLIQNTGLHLPKALAGCDWLVNSWDAQSCYGGAFMEFIVAGRGQSHHPHKKAGQADGHGDHDTQVSHDSTGHDMASHDMTSHDHAAMVAAADTFAIRNPNDPLYPCSAIDTKYQPSCYGMQAGIIIETVGADWGKIAAACDGAPVAMQPSCYQGIGTYVAGYTVLDLDKSIENCARGHDALQAWCYVGAVKNFIDVSSIPADGFPFCAKLTDRRYAVACYNAIGEQTSVLIRTPADREPVCAQVPSGYVEACRYGAGLPAPRPPELTPFHPSA